MISKTTLSHVYQLLFSVVAVAISLFHVWANTFGNVASLKLNAFHFAGFILLAVLLSLAQQRNEGEKRRQLNKLGQQVGFLLAVMAAVSAVYLVYAEDAIYDRGVRLSLPDWIAASIVVISAIEFTRRTTGWIIPVLIIIATSYLAFWGAYMPGIFSFAGLSVESLLFRSIYGDEAIFGSIASISSTFVFMFILFGAFLHASGASRFVVDLAMLMTRRFTGAPGFVAVIASALTGTISGSAVANTVSTGVITIPLMKRSGFPPRFAAGVEAAASTGGQIMPPIMGAGAFVMAANTQIPYTYIIVISILPAILYFATVGFFVRINAMRFVDSVQAPDDSKTPSLFELVRRGGVTFLVPFGVLIVLLVKGYTPTYSAGYAIVACILSSWMTPQRMGLKAIIGALQLGARNMIMTAILLCSIGLIVNVIATAGIGNTFSLMISSWSGGNLFIAIVLIALASLVLGMGLPVTAAYIVLSTLSAPALYQMILQAQLADIIHLGQLPETAMTIIATFVPEAIVLLSEGPIGIAEATSLVASLPIESLNIIIENSFSTHALLTALLTGHLVIFWLSQDSNVTPPVCLAAFTAAQIAKAPALASGLSAWKIAKGLYIMPLLFVYTPLISGSWLRMFEVFLFALPGLWALGAAIEGHGERKLNAIPRILIAMVGIGLLWPMPSVPHIFFLILFICFFVWHIRAIPPKISGPSKV